MEVKLGMSPISWTNDDLPELGGDTSLETCLKETRLAGMADGVGFEPTEGFHLRRFSRPVLSTAQSPIHKFVF